MIICRTPFRISFFGGGTDYPAWYRTHGGAVLAEIVRRLDQAGVEFTDLALRRPTLDDVFLTLTGHAAEEVSENGQAGGDRSDVAWLIDEGSMGRFRKTSVRARLRDRTRVTSAIP